MKNELWRRAALALTLIAVVAMTAYAQPGGGRGGGQRGAGGQRGGGFGGRGGFGGFGGFGGGGGGDIRFASRADVKKELDLSDDQVEEISALQDSAPDARAMMQDLGISMRDIISMPREEREDAMKPFMEKMAKENAKVREEVLEVLTSKQKSRYKQLKFQYDLSTGNLAGAVVSGGGELDDDEKEEVDEAKEDVEAKLQAAIAKLRIEMYAKALGSVIGESKVEKMVGEEFTFETTATRRGGRQGGEGRDGRAGGRQRGGGGGGGDNPRRRARPDDGDADSDDEDSNPRRRRRD